MKFKDWMICIGVSLLTLFAVGAIMMGCQAAIIDTGRAILHY